MSPLAGPMPHWNRPVEANNPARSAARRIVLPAGRAHSGGAGSDGFEFCSRNRRLCAHLGSLIIPFHLCAEHLLKHAAVGRQVIATHANIPGAVRTRKYLYGGERSSRRCHAMPSGGEGDHFPLLTGRASCPLYPQKRTLPSTAWMSALCQKRKSAIWLMEVDYDLEL
jgi:hypothetical protein